MSEAFSIQTPLDGVALDVHAEDVAGVRADLVGVVGQLDAAGLAPPADLHLGLDHDRVAEPVGGGHGVVDGRRPTSPGETGMPKRAKNCLPWYSKRST